MSKKIIIMSGVAALGVIATFGAQAHDFGAGAPYYEKTPGYYTAWSLPDGMGEAGYFGGSSGGIPGTGVPVYERGYDFYAPGIPPEDRPYPVWSRPSRLLR